MKKKVRRISVLLLVLMLVLGIAPLQAFALDPGVDTAVAGQVNQYGNDTTFTNNMPFATYRVYPSYLTVGGAHQVKDGGFKVLYNFGKNDKSQIVLKDYYHAAGKNADGVEIYDKVDPVVVFIADPNKPIKKNGNGSSVTLYGPVFSIEYEKAAIDAAGQSHNVILTFSDITMVNYSGEGPQNENKGKDAYSVALASGAISASAYMYDQSFDMSVKRTSDEVKPHLISRCGVKMTVTMKILDLNGDIENGSLNISFKDIDQKDHSQSTASYDTGIYSERVEVFNDSILSKAYITQKRPNTTDVNNGNLLRVSKGSNGLLFRATADNNDKFYSGFAVQVKPDNTLSWSGGSCATSLYGGTSTIAIRPLTKHYDNTNNKISDTWEISADGGSISMLETYNNSTISYTDESVKYGVGKYVTRFYTNLKPTTFTVGANEGYELVGMNYSTTYQSVNPSDGSLLDQVANNKVSHTLESGNGAHYTAAFYAPIVKTAKIQKLDQDGNPIQGVTFTITGTSAIHGEFTVSGVTDENGIASIANVPYGRDTDTYKLTETVPTGYRLPDNAKESIEFKYSNLGADTYDFIVTNQQVFTVSYSVEPDAEYDTPENVTVPVDNNIYDKGTDVDLASGLSSSQDYAINKAGETVPGTWSFEPAEGWSLTEGSYGSGVTKIERIDKNTTVYGKWTFTPESYEIDYVVEGDSTYGIPDGGAAPEDSTVVSWGENASLEPIPTTSWTTCDGKDGSAPGTWSFAPEEGWSLAEDDYDDEGVTTIEKVTSNQTVYGKWTFTPGTYTVSYDWGDTAPTEGLVETPPVLPEGSEGHDWHELLEADPTYDETTEIEGTDENGVPGVWKFSGWTPSKGLTEDGIEGDVVFTGEWTFEPYTYKLTYDWGDTAPTEGLVETPPVLPEGIEGLNWHDVPEIDEEYDADTKLRGTDESGAPGTWSFNGWTVSEELTPDGIEGNVLVTGEWSFTPDTYKVSYGWTGDIPEGVELPDSSEGHDWHEKLTADPTYDKTTEIIGTDENGVPGKYVFSGWTPSEELTEDGIEGNVKFTGEWTFEPYTYKLTYDWSDTAPTEGLVETPPVLPEGIEGLNWHDVPEIDEEYDADTKLRGTDENGAPGTWSFNGWTVSEELTPDGIEGNVLVTGEWSFTPDTYKVEYEWTGDVPEDVELPEGSEGRDWHEKLTADPTYDKTTEIIGTDENGVPGKYVFSGWIPSDELTEDGIEGNVVFTGEWTFVPDKYTVTYELGGDPKWGLPKDAAEAPVDSKKYNYNDEVKVAANLTTKKNFAIDPNTGEKVTGTWTFTPWDKENFKITGNTVVKGFWTFTPDVPEDAPKTGDTTNSTLWIVLLAVGAVGIAAAAIIGKKKKKEAE